MLSMVVLTACQSASSEAPVTSLAGTESGTIWLNSSSPYDFVNIIDGSAPSLTVKGVLDLPDGASAEAPVPAMIILHGSGGSGNWLKRYASAMTDIGVAAFTLDSFGPRGIQSTTVDQSSVTSQMMAADAFAAMRLLSTDPRIDGARIGVMGFSKGGIVALYSAFEGVAQWYADGAERFAAHVAFYPYCGILVDDTRLTGAPAIMLVGEDDNYTPAEQCLTLQAAVDPDAGVLSTVVYPGAHHGFTSTRTVQRYNYFNPSDCLFRVGADGVTRMADSGVSASTREERRAVLSGCGRFGVDVGGNPAARSQSMDDMKSFLRDAFGLTGS